VVGDACRGGAPMTLPDAATILAEAERIVGYPDAAELGRELGLRFSRDPRQLFESGAIGATRIFAGPSPGDSDYEAFEDTEAFWAPGVGVLCLAAHIHEGDLGWLEWVLRLAGHAALRHPAMWYYADGTVVTSAEGQDAGGLAAEAESFARGFIG
jgi:hypothetical protein